MSVRILQGDCRDVLATLPDASVHCVVTSPPYFGLRDYGTGSWSGGWDPSCNHSRTVWDGPKQTQGAQSGHAAKADRLGRRECVKCGAIRADAQMGSEPSLREYIAGMVNVLREVRRVLRDDGTLWLNIGDSYAGGGGGNYGDGKNVVSQGGQQVTNIRNRPDWLSANALKPKDLMMVPARLAIALQDDGWWLRSEIIWAKPNPMPESVTDRPTSAHEHVFLLTKSQRYFWDAEAVREACESGPSDLRKMSESLDRIGGKHKTLDDPLSKASAATAIGRKRSVGSPSGRNCRDVWTIATQPFPDAHFATFPPELAERCIRAGTSERGACPRCRAPWVRSITKGEPDKAHQKACGADATGGYAGQSTKAYAAARAQDASATKARILEGMRERTSNWGPSCDCPQEATQTVPCVVLDPFAGAFTTCMVADRLRCDAVGIELNPVYCDIARARLIKDAGMFAEIA